jgi:hypothetical protein
MSELKNLLKSISNDDNKISKEIAFSILKYSKNLEIIKMANNIIKDEALEIDLWELESLVNSLGFDYKHIKVDNVGIKDV